MKQKETKNKKNEQTGIYKVIRAFAPWFVLGALILFVYYFTGYGIPCVFRTVTGLYCPGCGMTRALVSLLFYGNISQAFHYNAMLFLVGPVLLFMAIRWTYYTIKQKDYTLSKFECIIITIMLILLLVFGVVRNVPLFSMLAPL